jgi:hypothetical protein
MNFQERLQKTGYFASQQFLVHFFYLTLAGLTNLSVCAPKRPQLFVWEV